MKWRSSSAWLMSRDSPWEPWTSELGVEAALSSEGVAGVERQPFSIICLSAFKLQSFLGRPRPRRLTEAAGLGACKKASGAKSQATPKLLQLPHGRCSSHLTLRRLQVLHPVRDLR